MAENTKKTCQSSPPNKKQKTCDDNQPPNWREPSLESEEAPTSSPQLPNSDNEIHPSPQQSPNNTNSSSIGQHATTTGDTDQHATTTGDTDQSLNGEAAGLADNFFYYDRFCRSVCCPDDVVGGNVQELRAENDIEYNVHEENEFTVDQFLQEHQPETHLSGENIENDEAVNVDGDTAVEEQGQSPQRECPAWYETRIRETPPNKYASVGGPENPTVLYEFESHIAFHIAQGKERGALTRNHHEKWKSDWAWRDNPNASFKKKVEESGLAHVIDYHPSSLDMSIVGGLIERWYPETNTFHLTSGEATITLDDVAKITGLKVKGIVPSSGRIKDVAVATNMVSTILGLPIEQVGTLFGKKKGCAVSLGGIRLQFENSLKADSPEEEVDRCVRAFLFYALGHTIFVDKSGERLQVHHLEDLKDVSKIKDVAFGLGCLTNVYYRLGEASRHTCRTLTGYMPLVEIWAFLHIPKLQKDRLSERETWVEAEKKPLIRKWDRVRSAAGSELDRLLKMRVLLDSLERQEFEWKPYGEDKDWDEIVLYRGIINWHNEKEAYHPDRVLRQFGYKPFLPGLPLIPDAPRFSFSGVGKGKFAFGDYATQPNFSTASNERLLSITDCDKVDTAEEQYMEWYASISHITVNVPKVHDAMRRIKLKKDIMNAKDMFLKAGDSYGEACARMEGFGDKFRDIVKVFTGVVKPPRRD